MMDFLMIPTVIGICTIGAYKLFELFVRRRERIMLIEKLDPAKLVDLDGVKLQLPIATSNTLSIGCLLIGFGLGLLVGFAISSCVNIDSHFLNTRDLVGIIYGGSLLLFGGAGLIASVLISSRMSRK